MVCGANRIEQDLKGPYSKQYNMAKMSVRALKPQRPDMPNACRLQKELNLVNTKVKRCFMQFQCIIT